MTTQPLSDEMVKRHGERYRRIIMCALSWLDREEGKWGLRQPLNRRTFVSDLLRNARKSENAR